MLILYEDKPIVSTSRHSVTLVRIDPHRAYNVPTQILCMWAKMHILCMWRIIVMICIHSAYPRVRVPSLYHTEGSAGRTPHDVGYVEACTMDCTRVPASVVGGAGLPWGSVASRGGEVA